MTVWPFMNFGGLENVRTAWPFWQIPLCMFDEFVPEVRFLQNIKWFRVIGLIAFNFIIPNRSRPSLRCHWRRISAIPSMKAHIPHMIVHELLKRVPCSGCSACRWGGRVLQQTAHRSQRQSSCIFIVCISWTWLNVVFGAGKCELNVHNTKEV